MAKPRAQMRLRDEWPGAVAVFLVAIAMRLWIRTSAIYGDEGFHYYISRTWGGDVHNVHLLGLADVFNADHLFWWRPAFMVLLTPGALLGFDAYRVLFIVFVSALAPLATSILRELDVRRWLAICAGAAIAIHPYYIAWGVRVFPDALMATAFAAGVWFWLRRWPIPAGLAFLLSVWCKESAVVGLAVVFLLEAWTGWRAGKVKLWPLRLEPMSTALLGALALALLPLANALRLGLTFPGWTRGGETAVLFDRLFISAWLIPLVLAGLLFRRARPLAILALTYPAFYLVYRLALGRAVEIWYFALPMFLVLVACVLVLDESLTRVRPYRAIVRAVPWASAAAVGLLLLSVWAVPAAAHAKGYTMPISHVRDLSLSETLQYELNRDQDLPDVVSHLRPTDWEEIFLIDVGWFFILHPFATQADMVRWGFTGGYVPVERDLPNWTDIAENRSSVTVLYKYDSAINHAFRATYADCLEYENREYAIYRAVDCPGRTQAFLEAYRDQSSAAGSPG